MAQLEFKGCCCCHRKCYALQANGRAKSELFKLSNELKASDAPTGHCCFLT